MAIAAVAVLIAVALAATVGAAAGWAAAAVCAAFLLSGVTAAGRTAARVITSPSHGSLEDIAIATADGLHAAGMTSKGGTAVRVEALADGSYRARLDDVTGRESELFSAALDEVLSPLAQPRYVVPRLIIPPPPGRGAAPCQRSSAPESSSQRPSSRRGIGTSARAISSTPDLPKVPGFSPRSAATTHSPSPHKSGPYGINQLKPSLTAGVLAAMPVFSEAAGAGCGGTEQAWT
jgi:hypothetical protein